MMGGWRWGRAVGERVLILGFGLDALVVAWVLRRNPNYRVAVMGSGPIGHRDVTPLPVLHSRAFARFLVELEIEKSSYQPVDGISLRGEVLEWPTALVEMPDPWARRVHADYLRKLSRLPVDLRDDFPRELPPRRLRFHPQDLADALTRELEVIRDDAVAIYPQHVRGLRCSHPFDKLVVTLPPWSMPPAFFRAPEAIVSRRHMFFVHAHERGLRRWDTVRAPYTPGRAAVRWQPFDSGFLVEVTGRFDERAARLDVGFFFNDARIEKGWLDLPGAPTFLDAPRLPDRVAFVGQYAEPGAYGEPQTLDGVFDRSWALLKGWAHARPKRKAKAR